MGDTITYDTLRASQRLLDTIYDQFKPHKEATLGSFAGIKMEPSTLFPFTSTCSKCSGTGDGGVQATYCPGCKGGGKVTYIGMMTTKVPELWQYEATKMALIVDYHAPLFQPAFPFAVPPRPVSYTKC